jgi:hypothetical protein
MTDPTSGKNETPPRGQDHWLARPRTIRLLWTAFLAILALTLVPDVFMEHHAEFGMEGSIGFNAWFGFASCVVLVLGSLALGRILKRKDTYYGD